MLATGCGNVGDECILESEYQYLRSRFPSAQFTIFTYSNDPVKRPNTRYTSYFPNSIRKYPIRNIVHFFSQIFFLARSDLVIIGGGGIFYDNEGNNFSSLLRDWRFRMYVAQFFRVPILIWSISLEILDPQNLARLYFLGSRGVSVSVRDIWSQEKLHHVGIEATLIYDPVFLLTSENTEKISLKKRVGIAVRGGYLSDESIVAIRDFLEWRDYSVVFLTHSFHSDPQKNDLLYVEKIFWQDVQGTCTEQETIDAYDTVDFVVAMRLHAGILAVTKHIPFCMISYGPKTEAFSELIGIDTTLDARGFTLETFRETFLRLEQEENAIKFALTQKSDMIREEILHSLDSFFDGLE